MNMVRVLVAILPVLFIALAFYLNLSESLKGYEAGWKNLSVTFVYIFLWLSLIWYVSKQRLRKIMIFYLVIWLVTSCTGLAFLLSEFAVIPEAVDLLWLFPTYLFLITPFYGLILFMNDFYYLVFTFLFSVLLCSGLFWRQLSLK